MNATDEELAERQAIIEAEREAQKQIDADMAALGLNQPTTENPFEDRQDPAFISAMGPATVAPEVVHAQLDSAERDFAETAGAVVGSQPPPTLPETSYEDDRPGWHVKVAQLDHANGQLETLLADGWEPFAVYSGNLYRVVAVRKFVE